MALLVALPALIFGVPALVGYPVLPGDDMTQNFPLRVLAGREIAAGHLPLFDSYAWSGSALLAGWNAGAAYPLTWLFAVLPGAAAWTAGLIATWATAGTGLYAFGRALLLRPVPAFAGALSFALAGAMSAQVTHFGLVAGMSWVPLALLAVLRLSQQSNPSLSLTDSGYSPGPGLLGRLRGTSRAQLRWTALLAASTGLIILAGEPRAVVDGYIIIAIYALWQTGRLGIFGKSWRRALPGTLLIACGVLLGASLGAVQWLPGLDAVGSSQRGSASMALFSAGSLPTRWLALTLVPDLLGGPGSFGQPRFFGSYNLTEVASYVGILPLVAAFALLGRACVSWRRRGGTPEYLVWHVMAVAGILLALGGNSPLAKVLYQLPLFGGQRLQSRNILLLDLALAILLAYWLDKPFPSPGAEGARGVSGVSGGSGVSSVSGVSGVAARRRLRLPSAETLAGLLPPLSIIVLVTLALTWGAGLLDWLGIPVSMSALEIGPLQPWLIPYAVLAALAAGLVIFGRRLGRRAWARACTAFVVTDVVVFTILGVVRVGEPAVAQSSAMPPSSSGLTLMARVSGPGLPAPARPVSSLGYQGRFAIYDPGLRDTADLTVIGPPNTNDMTTGGMPSVQGYSSIVDGTYAAATGSHQASGDGQNVLSPAAIGNGTLDALDTSVLLTLPGFLTTSSPAAGASGRSSTGASATTSAGTSGPGERRAGGGRDATWYLGQSVTVSRVVVPDASARRDAASGAEIGLVAPDGRTQWRRARAASGSALEIGLPVPAAATTVLTRDSRRSASMTLGAPSVDQNDGQVLVANGELQNALVPGRWTMAGFDGAFAVFRDTLAAGPLTVEPIAGSAGRYTRAVSGSNLAATVRPVMARPDTSMSGDVTAATVSSPHGVRLVRAVAAIPGWSATWQPRNGQAVTLSVQRDGVVQSVDVPAGRGTVTWHYMTPRFPAGLAISIAAALLTGALAIAGRRPRRLAPALEPKRELEPQPV